MGKTTSTANQGQSKRNPTAGARAKASLAKQPRAATMLACGTPMNAVSRSLKVSTETLVRWNKDPEFLAMLDREREMLNEAHREKARRLTDLALDKAIQAVMEDDRNIIGRVLSQSHLFSYGQGSGQAGEHRVRTEGTGVVIVREYYGAPDDKDDKDGSEPPDA